MSALKSGEVIFELAEMLLGTFDGVVFAYHKVASFFGLEERFQCDFSLLADSFEEDGRLKLLGIVVDTRIVHVDDFLGFCDLDEANSIWELASVGPVHDEYPFAARPNFHFTGCIGEACWSPPLVDVFGVGPYFEDQFAWGI